MYIFNRDKYRRQFFIKKEFQGKFIFLFAFCVVAPAYLAAFALYVQVAAAIERYLFSSHIKFSNTGEMVSGILIRTNLASSAIVIALVLVLSVYIFNRLNMHFYRMEERFDAIGRGDFSLPPQQESRFNEISTLIQLSEQTRQNYRERFLLIEKTLSRLDEKLVAESTAVELLELSDELKSHTSLIRLPDNSGVQTKEF